MKDGNWNPLQIIKFMYVYVCMNYASNILHIVTKLLDVGYKNIFWGSGYGIVIKEYVYLVLTMIFVYVKYVSGIYWICWMKNIFTWTSYTSKQQKRIIASWKFWEILNSTYTFIIDCNSVIYSNCEFAISFLSCRNDSDSQLNVWQSITNGNNIYKNVLIWRKAIYARLKI